MCVSGLKDALKQRLTDSEPTLFTSSCCYMRCDSLGPLRFLQIIRCVCESKVYQASGNCGSGLWAYTHTVANFSPYLSLSHTHWVIAPLYNYCALLSRACGIVSRRRPRSEAQSHHHRLVAVRLRDFYWVGAARLPHYINFAPYQRDNYVERQ